LTYIEASLARDSFDLPEIKAEVEAAGIEPAQRFGPSTDGGIHHSVEGFHGALPQKGDERRALIGLPETALVLDERLSVTAE
jgi:hypothetical protein